VPASNDLQRQARQAAQRLSATFAQTARVLAHSAVLAEDHAQREEQAGRPDAAASERLVADHAREAARRARAQADRLR
jgi:hypothetical protein